MRDEQGGDQLKGLDKNWRGKTREGGKKKHEISGSSVLEDVDGMPVHAVSSFYFMIGEFRAPVFFLLGAVVMGVMKIA